MRRFHTPPSLRDTPSILEGEQVTALHRKGWKPTVVFVRKQPKKLAEGESKVQLINILRISALQKRPLHKLLVFREIKSLKCLLDCIGMLIFASRKTVVNQVPFSKNTANDSTTGGQPCWWFTLVGCEPFSVCAAFHCIKLFRCKC